MICSQISSSSSYFIFKVASLLLSGSVSGGNLCFGCFCFSSLWVLGEGPCCFPLPPQGLSLAQDPNPAAGVPPA